MFRQIQTYDTKLPQGTKDKPTSYHKAGNTTRTQWFQAEAKERDGILEFNTWTRLTQNNETRKLRKTALRAHHLYDIKRDMSAKNRVVVNGSRQSEDTYSDTTSPVASQMQLRIFLFFTAARKYYMEQLDLTNAYLHAPIKDTVHIIIPAGFPGQGEVARLDKAAYGTKQGARRFYDHAASTLKEIGMKQCAYEPCLFRYVLRPGEECFLLQYVDDSLIAGTKKAIESLKEKLRTKFKCKFQIPKDFLGMDIEHVKLGEIKLSMRTFTTKMISALGINKQELAYPILTPGRTDKKIVRDQEPEPNEKYRSHVGALNWLTMCLRYDLTYTTKELSRVLQQPTKTANEILNRAVKYAAQTSGAYLSFRHDAMLSYTPPKTRKKPTDQDTKCYATDDYNLNDGITQPDDAPTRQDFVYTGPGENVIQTCMTDIDLAGQVETRQSTSGTMHYLNGVLVHWRGRTERLIVHTTAAGEYIALSRGNTTAKYIRDIMIFYGNNHNLYHLYTDNQAAEHIATQPNMNDHSRSIDIRIHGIRQDYLDNAMRIGGVASEDNTSDILTKNLQPYLHQRHCAHLHLPQHHKQTATKITNNALQYSPPTSNVHEEMLPTLQQRKPTQMPEILPRHVSINTRPQHQPTQPQTQTINLVELRDGETLFPTQPIEPRVDELRELGVGVHLGLEQNPGVFIPHHTLEKQA